MIFESNENGSNDSPETLHTPLISSEKFFDDVIIFEIWVYDVIEGGQKRQKWQFFNKIAPISTKLGKMVKNMFAKNFLKFSMIFDTSMTS